MSNPRRTPMPRSGHGTALAIRTAPLNKGATFHASHGLSEPLPFVPSLPRRSHTNLDDVIDAHRRRIALTLDHIDEALTAAGEGSSAARKSLRDDPSPLPRGLLGSTATMAGAPNPNKNNNDAGDVAAAGDTAANSGGRDPQPRQNNRRSAARFHESDSGLGTSLAGSSEKRAADGAHDKATAPVRASAITRSAAAAAAAKFPGLSPRATNRIFEHTLKPLLARPAFKDFHPLVLECPKKIQDKQIVCLRDLEKTLLLTAPVSKLLNDKGPWGNAYRSLTLKERTKIAGLYLDFCLTSIACIQATVEYLGDREQTRPHDVPYSNGYFIDLVDQIQNYARQLADADNSTAAAAAAAASPDSASAAAASPASPTAAAAAAAAVADKDYMDLDSADEIRLHGGMAINGRPAELVRVKKDGTAYSLATGKRVDDIEEHSKDAIRFKRSASQQLEDEEEIMRSMARRKKNAPPEEYAPKQCREPGCDKEFKRPCDLTKHEKTHSRPWKCPVKSCKFHEFGWPTEKEMDRHHNDKHSKAPPMYECLFKPCPYKSKRESNCKQHMEKAHNWTYVRTKTTTANRKDESISSKQDSAPQVTPQLTNMPTPRSDKGMNVTTPPDGERIFDSIEFPPYDQFPPLDLPQDIHIDLSPPMYGSPSSSLDHDNSAYRPMSEDFGVYDDIYNAHAQLLTPMHHVFSGKQMDQQLAAFAAPQNQQMVPTHPPHFSPTGQANAMLYTPKSYGEFDDFCDDFSAVATANGGVGHHGGVGGGDDFLLFPPADLTKQPSFDPLFCEMPSVAGGYSEPSSQTFMQAEWVVTPPPQNYNGYNPYGQN